MSDCELWPRKLARDALLSATTTFDSLPWLPHPSSQTSSDGPLLISSARKALFNYPQGVLIKVEGLRPLPF